MSRMTHRVLCFAMAAVVFAAAGLNGAFACADIGSVGADIHVAAHDHVAHDHASHGAGHAAHDHGARQMAMEPPAESDHGNHGPADCDDCTHMHVHCCASVAVPSGDMGLKLAFALTAPLPDHGALFPLGQLFYPLLRPPRAAA